MHLRAVGLTAAPVAYWFSGAREWVAAATATTETVALKLGWDGGGFVKSENKRLLCRLGVHRFADFPDPNPETGRPEQQGYQACRCCPKEKDQTFYAMRPGRLRFPA